MKKAIVNERKFGIYIVWIILKIQVGIKCYKKIVQTKYNYKSNYESIKRDLNYVVTSTMNNWVGELTLCNLKSGL